MASWREITSQVESKSQPRSSSCSRKVGNARLAMFKLPERRVQPQVQRRLIDGSTRRELRVHDASLHGGDASWRTIVPNSRWRGTVGVRHSASTAG